MTNIEQKALALVNEVNVERGYIPYSNFDAAIAALCRAIEQHEAFRQEVSDVAEEVVQRQGKLQALLPFIIPAPKPDLLFDVLWDLGMADDRKGVEFMANRINETLDARGFEIREKSK